MNDNRKATSRYTKYYKRKQELEYHAKINFTGSTLFGRMYSNKWVIYCVIQCNYYAIENVFRVCIAWYKHERGWENSRQLCKPDPSSVYIRLCKHRKKVFYCFYKINFPRKDAKLYFWHWLKEKFLPVAQSCPRSLARVISSCFAKGCFPKYGLFSLKMSA